MKGRLKLKLSKKPRGEGYWAHLGDRDEMSFDQVLQEAALNSSFSPNMLKSAFEMVMETMIRGTLNDGISRTAGDYFKLRLDVRGTFETPYDYFDEDKHELALNLQVLKGLKKFASASLVKRPYVPVVLESISNPGGEDGAVDLTKDILIKGKHLRVNLETADEGVDWKSHKSPRGKTVTDVVILSVRCKDGHVCSVTLGRKDIIENDSSHILIQAQPITRFVDALEHEPYLLEVEVFSCGEEATARRQKHTIKAKLMNLD